MYILWSVCLKFSSHKNGFLKGEMSIALSHTLCLYLGPLLGQMAVNRVLVTAPECAWLPHLYIGNNNTYLPGLL